MDKRGAARGFTLLEVMVSVAILGLGLTAILSAQAGAFAASAHARNISVATGLARCKMSEVEELLLRDGFQELDQNESGPCCDGDDAPGMSCAWRIEKPALPEPKLGELDLDTDLGALGKLAGGEGDKAAFAPGGGTTDVAQTLAGANTAEAAAGIAGMLMNMIYPDLKGVFEASTRKATIIVSWTRGEKKYSLELVQWITSPQQGGLVGDLPEGAEPDEPGAAAGATGAPGGGTSSGGRTPTGGRPPLLPQAPK
jgi:general secretion pathway protein I